MGQKHTRLVVKDNALINASYSLNLVEQRLILLAIVEAREKGLTINANNSLTVHAESYATQFNVHRNTAYEALKDACENLFERRFSYEKLTARGNKEHVKSRWVQEISYVENEALVRVKFSSDVVPLIINLEKRFTSYEISKVAKLSSTYAIRLYELLMSWKSLGKTPLIKLEDFRLKLGVETNEYPRMDNFKKFVLGIAIEQINEHTDISVSYEQHKKGRTISGFSFTFSYKKDAQAASKRCSKTIDFIDEQNLTAKQLGYYAKLLARSHWATQARVLQGVNANDAVSVLMNHLKQPKNFEKRKALIAELVKEDQHKKDKPS